MKRMICLVLSMLIALSLCVPHNAAAEELTKEELIATLDPELDSDGDGLVDIIEIYYDFDHNNPDTDGDGVTDYTEFCITCTDVLVPDGDIDTDGDGLTNAEEGAYGTNPDDLDSDNDNFGDYEEIMVLGTDPCVKNITDGSNPNPLSPSNEQNEEDQTVATPWAIKPPTMEELDPGHGGSTPVYSGVLHTTVSGVSYTSNISYRLNFDWFQDCSSYSQQLAITSSVLSAITYDNNYISITEGGTLNTNAANAVEDWMEFHGMSNFYRYDFDEYTDQHVSEAFMARKVVTYGDETKNVIVVAIRGTNGTLDEWQSNFDVGSTEDYATTPGWNTSSNHMGFDITASRLNNEINNYLSTLSIDRDDCIFWITGHSRGGALANLVAAKRIAVGDDVVAYTFASPATTTSAAAKSSTYDCIFNIINEDDFVPQLPMESWDFVRYGQDKPGSIEDSYALDWDMLVSGSEAYTSNRTMMNNLVSDFSAIADDRNSCYEYPLGGFYTSQEFVSYDFANSSATQVAASFPSNTEGTYYWLVSGTSTGYYYSMFQQPAFIMQLIAGLMGGEITDVNFATLMVPLCYWDAKGSLTAFAHSGYMNHPHYVESYYLLATKID